jgi:hypothetical protein
MDSTQMANQTPANLPVYKNDERSERDNRKKINEYGLTSEEVEAIVELFIEEEEEEREQTFTPPAPETQLSRDEILAMVHEMLPEAIEGYNQLEQRCAYLSKECTALMEQRKHDDELVGRAYMEITSQDATILALRETIRALTRENLVLIDDNNRLRRNELAAESISAKKRKPNV